MSNSAREVSELRASRPLQQIERVFHRLTLSELRSDGKEMTSGEVFPSLLSSIMEFAPRFFTGPYSSGHARHFDPRAASQSASLRLCRYPALNGSFFSVRDYLFFPTDIYRVFTCPKGHLVVASSQYGHFFNGSVFQWHPLRFFHLVVRNGEGEVPLFAGR